MVFLLLVLGMVLLMKGADLFVDGSASVARKLKSTFSYYWFDNCCARNKLTRSECEYYGWLNGQ